MPAKKRYPPADPNFDWVTSQAPRHEAAKEFYGGTTISIKEGFGAHRLMNPLYTSPTGKEAVEYAMQATTEGNKGKPSSQQAQGKGVGSEQEEDWLEKEGKGFTHMQAIFLQVRMAGQLITRFQPFRHTVIIAGRPVQAAWTEPNVEPPAMRFDHMFL